MGFMGLETAHAPSGMRGRRLAAFFIDAFIVLMLSFIAFHLFGEPDFFSVKEAMDAAELAGGQDAVLTGAVFSTFNRAYGIMLVIGFFYEVVSQFIFGGSTVGKLLCRLKVISRSEERKKAVHALFLCVRSFLKMLSLYFFQSFPFLICCLTIFTNKECYTGFDMAVKTITVDRKKEQR